MATYIITNNPDGSTTKTLRTYGAIDPAIIESEVAALNLKGALVDLTGRYISDRVNQARYAKQLAELIESNQIRPSSSREKRIAALRQQLEEVTNEIEEIRSPGTLQSLDLEAYENSKADLVSYTEQLAAEEKKTFRPGSVASHRSEARKEELRRGIKLFSNDIAKYESSHVQVTEAGVSEGGAVVPVALTEGPAEASKERKAGAAKTGVATVASENNAITNSHGPAPIQLTPEQLQRVNNAGAAKTGVAIVASENNAITNSHGPAQVTLQIKNSHGPAPIQLTPEQLQRINAGAASTAEVPALNVWQLQNAQLGFHLNSANAGSLGGDLTSQYDAQKNTASLIPGGAAVAGTPKFNHA